MRIVEVPPDENVGTSVNADNQRPAADVPASTASDGHSSRPGEPLVSPVGIRYRLAEEVSRGQKSHIRRRADVTPGPFYLGEGPFGFCHEVQQRTAIDVDDDLILDVCHVRSEVPDVQLEVIHEKILPARRPAAEPWPTAVTPSTPSGSSAPSSVTLRAHAVHRDAERQLADR